MTLVDLETELEQSRKEVETLNECLRASEERANATVTQANGAEEKQVQLTAVQEETWS